MADDNHGFFCESGQKKKIVEILLRKKIRVKRELGYNIPLHNIIMQRYYRTRSYKFVTGNHTSRRIDYNYYSRCQRMGRGYNANMRTANMRIFAENEVEGPIKLYCGWGVQILFFV
jgi:hypothetical protein